MELLGLDCVAPLTLPSDPESHSMPPLIVGRSFLLTHKVPPSAGSPSPALEMKNTLIPTQVTLFFPSSQREGSGFLVTVNTAYEQLGKRLGKGAVLYPCWGAGLTADEPSDPTRLPPAGQVWL